MEYESRTDYIELQVTPDLSKNEENSATQILDTTGVDDGEESGRELSMPRFISVFMYVSISSITYSF